MKNEIRTDAGVFVISEAPDPNYPGVDIEFIADESQEDTVSNPRICFEYSAEDRTLQAYAWTDMSNEDFTHKITFDVTRTPKYYFVPVYYPDKNDGGTPDECDRKLDTFDEAFAALKEDVKETNTAVSEGMLSEQAANNFRFSIFLVNQKEFYEDGCWNGGGDFHEVVSYLFKDGKIVKDDARSGN